MAFRRCTLLLGAILLIGCGDGSLAPLPLPYQADPGGAGVSGDQATMSVMVQATCQKLAVCGMLQGLTVSQCVAEVGKLVKDVSMLFPFDANFYAGCIQQLSCFSLTAKVKNPKDHPITQCTGIDYNNLACTGPTTFKICNLSSVCKVVDCSQICKAVSAKYTNGKCKTSGGMAGCSCGTPSSTPKPDYGDKKYLGQAPDGGLPY